MNCVIHLGCMTKIQTGTSLEDALLQRIKLIARVDRRSVSDVVAWCVELGLPRLEEELHDRAGKLKEITSAPATKHPSAEHPVKYGKSSCKP